MVIYKHYLNTFGYYLALLKAFQASLVAQMVKSLPAMQGT